MQNKQSIQAYAHKALRSNNGGFSFYFLLHRRCVPLGISHRGVISRRDVTEALACACRTNHVAAIAWLKTVTSAWCTSYRMHETHKLCCIFGCRTCPDRIDHYIICPILWSLLDDAFGGSLTPCIFSRLNLAFPSERNLHILAAAFDIYHALEIGLRSTVDVANSSFIFAPVLAQAKVLARDHGARCRDLSLSDSSSSSSSDADSSSASSFSDVSA